MIEVKRCETWPNEESWCILILLKLWRVKNLWTRTLEPRSVTGFSFILEVQISMAFFAQGWHATNQPWLKAQVARKKPSCCRQHLTQLRSWAQGFERMSLSTSRRRSNSRTMDGGPTYAAQHEDRARGPDRPGRGGGTGGGGENGRNGCLEIGVADHRLDALMEEDRRAMSVPVQPGVRRLALVMVEHNKLQDLRWLAEEMVHNLDKRLWVGCRIVERSEGRKPWTRTRTAAGCSAAVFWNPSSRSWSTTGSIVGPPQALGPPPPVHGPLAPLAQGLDHGNQGGSVPGDRGERLLLQTPLDARGGRRAGDRHSRT